MRNILIGVMVIVTSATVVAQDNFSYARRIYLEKAQCSYCHGWAGDGAGEGQSNRGPNLRQTRLNRELLVVTIMCGRPGTAMPHYDEAAYSDKRCYGMTKKELGSLTPSLPLGSTLRTPEAEAIADYLLAKFVGRGSVTRPECEESFGIGARSCREYPAKP